MNDTFASLLEGCRPLFPASLVDAAGWEQLMEPARALPRSVIDVHLAQPGAAADLCVVALLGSDLSRHYIRVGARAEPGSAAAALREQTRNPASFIHLTGLSR